MACFCACAADGAAISWIHRRGSADGNARYAAAFRNGLNEIGYNEGQNVTVEYHWLEGHYDRTTALIADLIRRQVAVITTPGNAQASIAAKAATMTIPIVFARNIRYDTDSDWIATLRQPILRQKLVIWPFE